MALRQLPNLDMADQPNTHPRPENNRSHQGKESGKGKDSLRLLTRRGQIAGAGIDHESVFRPVVPYQSVSTVLSRTMLPNWCRPCLPDYLDP